MRISKTGVALCALYRLVTIACILASFIGSSDVKGDIVLLQLPIALQLALADKAGLYPFLSGASWVVAYVLFALPTVVLLYACGLVLERIFRRSRRRTGA